MLSLYVISPFFRISKRPVMIHSNHNIRWRLSKLIKDHSEHVYERLSLCHIPMRMGTTVVINYNSQMLLFI